MDKKISVSTEPAKDLAQLVDYLKIIEPNADMLHFDIMDGKFVENTTFNYQDIAVVRALTTLPFDVHLMIDAPKKYIKKYISSGANILTIHYEAFENKNKLVACLKEIKSFKALVGLAINPETKISEIQQYLKDIDVLVVMSVVPGKSGQNFINEIYEKLEIISDLKKKNNLHFAVEVDGGITPAVAKKLKQVDLIVSGSYIYNSLDKSLAINSLKK